MVDTRKHGVILVMASGGGTLFLSRPRASCGLSSIYYAWKDPTIFLSVYARILVRIPHILNEDNDGFVLGVSCAIPYGD